MSNPRKPRLRKTTSRQPSQRRPIHRPPHPRRQNPFRTERPPARLRRSQLHRHQSRRSRRARRHPRRPDLRPPPRQLPGTIRHRTHGPRPASDAPSRPPRSRLLHRVFPGSRSPRNRRPRLPRPADDGRHRSRQRPTALLRPGRRLPPPHPPLGSLRSPPPLPSPSRTPIPPSPRRIHQPKIPPQRITERTHSHPQPSRTPTTSRLQCGARLSACRRASGSAWPVSSQTTHDRVPPVSPAPSNTPRYRRFSPSQPVIRSL